MCGKTNFGYVFFGGDLLDNSLLLSNSLPRATAVIVAAAAVAGAL